MRKSVHHSDFRGAGVHARAISLAPEHFVSPGSALTLALAALGAVDELRLIDAQGRLLARVRPVLAPDAR